MKRMLRHPVRKMCFVAASSVSACSHHACSGASFSDASCFGVSWCEPVSVGAPNFASMPASRNAAAVWGQRGSLGRANLSALLLTVWFAAAALGLLSARIVHAAPQQANVSAGAANVTKSRVIELRIDGEIEPIMAEYIDDGIDQAAKEHASLVFITMDTPGGLESSMMMMIQHILMSPVPVVVYVSPTGARGASAGFFILLSADVAAMAPGTHTGRCFAARGGGRRADQRG